MHYRLSFYGVRRRYIFSIVETTSLNKIGDHTSVQFRDTLLRPLEQCFFLSDNKDLCSILPYPPNCSKFRALNRKHGGRLCDLILLMKQHFLHRHRFPTTDMFPPRQQSAAYSTGCRGDVDLPG